MNIGYLDLVDYLAIAAEVTGLSVETIAHVAKLDLADSALHELADLTGHHSKVGKIARPTWRHAGSPPRLLRERDPDAAVKATALLQIAHCAIRRLPRGLDLGRRVTREYVRAVAPAQGSTPRQSDRPEDASHRLHADPPADPDHRLGLSLRRQMRLPIPTNLTGSGHDEGS